MTQRTSSTDDVDLGRLPLPLDSPLDPPCFVVFFSFAGFFFVSLPDDLAKAFW